MKITQIKRIGNTNRFHVYANGAWVGVFLDEILVFYSIKTDAEFSDAEFEAIKRENDEKVAFDMAADYLEKYVVSEKGIKDYLKRKGFSRAVIEKTCKKMKEYGFVDDERFAKASFESLQNKNGKRAIAQKLKQRGVNEEIVASLLENVDEEREIENATYLAEKFVKNRQKDAKIKQKCLAHLLYKGYDYSVAQKATANALSSLKIFADDANEANEADDETEVGEDLQ